MPEVNEREDGRIVVFFLVLAETTGVVLWYPLLNYLVHLGRKVVECMRCTRWIYVTVTGYVETTGVFPPGTCDTLPGDAY